MNGNHGKMSRYICFEVVLLCFCAVTVKCWNYNLASLTELSLLTKEGKQLWESLSEKVDVPRYGSCWRNAISDLRLGCKFLSENVQSDLALRFTDCFLQMSGYEPMSCTFARGTCLKELSDRAFNAYTEFYTHTQSICYFLQSQTWHEETRKTVDRLSEASLKVSAQLEEGRRIQEKILRQQKETLDLQRGLIDHGRKLASALELSEEKLTTIMGQFHDSAVEQKKLLFDVFEKLNVLHSWTMGEMSWINSLLFYLTSIIIGYLFTSMSSTQQARIYIFLLLTLNYCLERFIESQIDAADNLGPWIWLCRKSFVVLSAMVVMYKAMVFTDYNSMNYKILLEIKSQNNEMLKKMLERSCAENDAKRQMDVGFYNGNKYGNPELRRESMSNHRNPSPVLCHRTDREQTPDRSERATWRDFPIDDIDNTSTVCEKTKEKMVRRETPYNLRSTRSRN